MTTLLPIEWSSPVYAGIIAFVILLRVWHPWPGVGRWHFIDEFTLILPAGLFYFFVRGMTIGAPDTAYHNALHVIDAERALGIAWEASLQGWIASREMVVTLLNWVYIFAHWPVILGWVVWMWSRHQTAYVTYRNAVLISGAAGMVVFVLFPVAPPRLMPDFGVIDTVILHSNAYRVLQPPALTNQYAAMPSLHFGWNLLVGIAIARHATTLGGRVFGVLLPIAMLCAVVLTGNHYILDAVAGGIFALAGLAAAVWIGRRAAKFNVVSDLGGP